MSKSNSFSSSKSEPVNSTAREEKSFFSSDAAPAFFQPKLSIGQPDDKFEKEADHVADKVIRKKGMEEEEPAIQRQEITTIQRLATPLEDENFATNDERMKRDRELREKPELQQKCSHCEEEEKKGVQKKADEREDVRKKEDEKKDIRKKGDEKKDVRKKEEQREDIQKKEGGAIGGVASAALSSKIDSSHGKGSSLPPSTLAEMQTGFGENFSGVNIHTDSEAVNMNRELGAQAFTHGSDIYFNTGKFNPDSRDGKHLLAHELTHVVQQGAAGPKLGGAGLQRKIAAGTHIRRRPIEHPSLSGPSSSSGVRTKLSPSGGHAQPGSSRTHIQPSPARVAVQRRIQRAPDHIPETQNQFYGHGAFMAAAPQLMADKKWNRILQALMPDVHAAATKTLSKGPNSPELILQFENNPVMAAYGMYMTKRMDAKKQNNRDDRIKKMEAIEWDAFLPTGIVEKFKKAKKPEDKERLAQGLVDEMIIAHGNRAQTIVENLPWYLGGGSRQYEDVKGTAKAGQGGVRPGAWMDLFGRALQLAIDPDWEKKAKEYEDPKLHPRVDSPKDQAAHGTFKNQLPCKDVIRLYKQMFGKDRFSVLLDVKSRDATPDVLMAMTTELNRRGVYVYGIGSFKHGELTGLSKMDQTVDGKKLSGPKEVKFFHLAGNLQAACIDEDIKPGDTVMFNAGSLISYSVPVFGKPKKQDYKIKEDVVVQLKDYKEHWGFHLGVYVQENDIDERAATLLTELTNRRPDIFDLGFAWGGLSGQTAGDIAPSWGHATVGLFGQDSAAVGAKDWDTSKKPPALMAIHSQPVPLISELTYQQAQQFIVDKNFAAALEVVMQDLIAGKKVDIKKFTYKFEDDPDQGEGLTRPPKKRHIDQTTGQLIFDGPSEVIIFTQAFASVHWLVSSVMHEYQHVEQQQRPHDPDDYKSEKKGGHAGEFLQISEVEAYLWELENLKQTGVVALPGSIRDLYERLLDHYNKLGTFSKTSQARFTARVKAAALLVTAKSKEEEELEKCDNETTRSRKCERLYEKVRDRYGNKERKYGFNPDKDVNKKRIRRDDPPVMDSFRKIYNRLDSWDIYILHKYSPKVYEAFQGFFKLNDKRLKWLSELKQDTVDYKSEFRDLSHFDIEKTRKDYEAKTLKRIEGEIDQLNRAIAVWFKLLTLDPDDIDTIIEKVNKAGTELWRQDWRDLILMVNRVISSLWPPARQRIIEWVNQQRRTHPGADLSGKVEELDYVGSLATGYKGAPKQFVRFNIHKFDVDANLEAPPLAKWAMNFDHIRPDRKRIFAVRQGSSITPLLNFAFDTHHALSNIPGYDLKEQFDVVIHAPELPDQKWGREGTERIYKLREKIGEVRYDAMISELKAAGLMEEIENGWRLREEMTSDDNKQLGKIIKKYE
jgi:hypothetical protein